MAETDTKSVISQTVKELIMALAPILDKQAVTPEIMAAAMREAIKPYQDPDAIARTKRERELSRRQYLDGVSARNAMQRACPHKHKDNQNALCLTHNFPDGQPRGICPLCQLFIQPAHWEIGLPDAEHPEGKPYIVAEHSQYFMVREKEAMS